MYNEFRFESLGSVSKKMSQNGQIKIFLIGDYLIFRVGLKMLIESQDKFLVVREAEKFSDISDTILQLKPDVVLINELELRNEQFSSFMERHSQDVRVLIFSDSDDRKMSENSFKIGAQGLISKKVNKDILFRAIEQIYNGQFWYDRSFMGETMRQMINKKQIDDDKSKEPSDSSLTEREWDVLTQICKGLKNKDIADNLFISEATVKHHVASIFEKLGVKTRLELVVYAFQNRLIEVPPQKNNGNGKHN